MLKKIVLSALLATLVGGVTLGTGLGSYVSTAWNRCTQTVERAVPVEFQIDRARQMVRDLAPEVRRSMEVLAKEEIELERLEEKIDATTKQTAKSKDEIIRLQSDLDSDRDVFRYAGHSYERSQVTEDLSRRFTRHKIADETLAHLQDMYRARTANLDAARQKLTAMIAAQKKLETDIVNLEAKRQLVQVAQASSDVVALDESQLSRAKGLISDIRSRLDVASRLANADTSFPGEIQLDPAASEDVSEQVAAYFSLKSDASLTNVKEGGKITAVSTTISLD